MSRDVPKPGAKQVIWVDDPGMLKAAEFGHENGIPRDDAATFARWENRLEAHIRKHQPVFSGVLRYFPDALAAVSVVSLIGNEQHNPGTALHWDRSKSSDEWDALTRHLLEVGTFDTDGVRHAAKVAWRALAGLQKEIEAGKITPEGDPSCPLPLGT